MELKEFVEKKKIVLLDGATGSQLFARGLTSGDCPELWNETHPSDIKEIAELYFSAGSDAVYTNTFGGSALKLKHYGLDQKTFELNFAGAQNAIAVKKENQFVFGSIGPSGEMLEPFGEVSESEMIESFSMQAKALDEAKVDCFVLETFSDLNELECAIKAVKENSKLPFIASMTFDKTPTGYKTMMGVSIDEAAKALLENGAFVVGSNCGNGIEQMIEIGNEFRSFSFELKLLLKANAGFPQVVDGKTCYTENPEYFEKFSEKLFAVKPTFIGGCCGTTPEHIKTLRKIINTR